MIRGDYIISGATLNRFFALHVIALPIVLAAYRASRTSVARSGFEQPRRYRD
ncbi:hypothetical protein OH492_23105 [Vibrio chagasii]|nr:hypothetical protein [Vibrio chagasii]